MIHSKTRLRPKAAIIPSCTHSRVRDLLATFSLTTIPFYVTSCAAAITVQRLGKL